MTIYVWIGTRHESTGHIWFDPPNEMGLIGMHEAAGEYRHDEAVQMKDLASRSGCGGRTPGRASEFPHGEEFRTLTIRYVLRIELVMVRQSEPDHPA